MDVERVEHHGIAAASLGDLARGCVCQRVGAADDEACESQARIERRAAERVMAGRDRCARGRAQLDRAAAIDRLGAARIEGNRCLFCRRGRAHRRAHGEIDPMHFRQLGPPGREHALGIMRLNPALQEARRHRQAYRGFLDRFQVHARKPARIDVVADLGAQTLFDP
jgi:hypothetical protein